jgi:hypothetical protein
MGKTKTTKKSARTPAPSSGGVSTIRAMNDRLASMTAAAKSKIPARASTPAPKTRVKGGSEPMTYDGITRRTGSAKKSVAQNHSREDAAALIDSLRKKVAELYRTGKIKSSAALMVPLTHIDNATYHMCCGEFDQSVETCRKCEENVLSNY